jgi:hypothetical protein
MQLVIQDSAFGDWILTWPLLRALAHRPVTAVQSGGDGSPGKAAATAALPDPTASGVSTDTPPQGSLPVLEAPTTWIVTGWQRARLAARYIDGLTPVDVAQPRWSRLFAPGFADEARAAAARRDGVGEHEPGLDREAAEMADALARATFILSYVSRGSDTWADNVRALAPNAAIAFVPPRPPQDWPGHVLAWQRACLDETGITLSKVEDDAAVVDPPAGDPHGPVLIHPGSGGEAKRWPRERFEALASALDEEGLPVQLVLGLVEWQQWGDVALRHWCGELGAQVLRSPGELARSMSGARAYVGNDSGPTHLAARLGLPTLALFGPTSPARWMPRGPRVHVLAPESPEAMDWLAVERVQQALGRILA